MYLAVSSIRGGGSADAGTFLKKLKPKTKRSMFSGRPCNYASQCWVEVCTQEQMLIMTQAPSRFLVPVHLPCVEVLPLSLWPQSNDPSVNSSRELNSPSLLALFFLHFCFDSCLLPDSSALSELCAHSNEVTFIHSTPVYDMGTM